MKSGFDWLEDSKAKRIPFKNMEKEISHLKTDAKNSLLSLQIAAKEDI